MKKKIVISVLAVCLMVAWIVRFIDVNRKTKDAEIRHYDVGEVVAIEDNYFVHSTENMNGYEVIVNSARVMDYGEYLKKYGLTEKDVQDRYPPDKVYDVHITLRNIDNTTGGIYLPNWILQGVDQYTSINLELYRLVNPEANGVIAVALRPGTEMDFYLPFDLREYHYNKRTWKNIDSYPISLVVSKYPVKKMIDIVKR